MTRAKAPWDVADEVLTVADAVRIGREAAQQIIATAAMLAIGSRSPEDVPIDVAVEVHLFTVEAVSELTTAPVQPATDRTESESKG